MPYRFLQLAVAMLVFAVQAASAAGLEAEQPMPETTLVGEDHTAGAVLEGGGEPDPLTDEEREKAVTAAVYLFAGILFVGFVLIAFVVFWGARMRRIVRAKQPRPTAVDDLWYLRPGKPRSKKQHNVGSDSDIIESQA